MERVGVQTPNIYINVNNHGSPNSGVQFAPARPRHDPYEILDLRRQPHHHQPQSGNYLSYVAALLQSLLRSINSRHKDDDFAPTPNNHSPNSSWPHSGEKGEPSCNVNSSSQNGNGFGGPSVNGFSKQPQTRAYTQDETRAMGKQITESLMKDLGITRQQAAGIVGNLMQESGLNPAINQGGKIGKPDPSAPGYGWVQWSGPRRKEYENFARQQGLDPGSPAANYAFLVKELKGPYSGVLNNLKQTNSVVDAARVIFAEYEIPGDGSLPVRIQYANQSLAWA